MEIEMDVSCTGSLVLSTTARRRSILGGGLALSALALAPTTGFASPKGAGTAAGSRRLMTGVPLFVDTVKDLASHPGSVLESWYVNAAFESRGKVLGFEWHQGIAPQASMTEFLLMNGTDGIWRPHVATEPASAKVGASTTECRVYSSLGTFSGDRSQFRLKLRSGRNAVDVVLTPQREELYNGTTGLLPLMGSNSYEFAFPNMRAKGTVTIDDEVFPVDAGSVWFDRQWSPADGATPAEVAKRAEFINQAHWNWLGLSFGAGDRAAISFWDIMAPEQRWNFLTYLREDGVQMNVGAKVDYEGLWVSKDTGQRYPRSAHIVAPAIDLDIVLTALLERPEFVYPPGQGHSGCQSLCRVTGKVGATRISKHTIFEMIGGIDL
jgi:predicted secreted hydrolase